MRIGLLTIGGLGLGLGKQSHENRTRTGLGLGDTLKFGFLKYGYVYVNPVCLLIIYIDYSKSILKTSL